MENGSSYSIGSSDLWLGRGESGTALKQVKEFKSKQESVKRRVRELRASGDEAWEDFKGEVEEATKDLKAALKRAASRFKKS